MTEGPEAMEIEDVVDLVAGLGRQVERLEGKVDALVAGLRARGSL